MYVIGANTFFQVLREFTVKLLVFVGIRVRLLVKEFNDSLGKDVTNSLDESAILQVLTAEVEGHVFLKRDEKRLRIRTYAVSNTLNKSQPVRHQSFAFILDENLAREQGNTDLLSSHTVLQELTEASWVSYLLHVRFRNVEQALKSQWSIGLEVDDVRRRVVGASDELVELFVLFGANIFGLLHPNGSDGVNLLAIKIDREANEVRVSLNHIWDRVKT